MEHALELGGAVSKTTETPARPPAPNFFDVVACETTKSLLHPVLYQGLFYAVGRLPNHWLLRRMTRNFEELYLALDLVIEGASLCSRRATICEDYYGMTRSPLDRRLILLSLLEACVIPYLMRRLKQHLHEARNDGDTRRRWRLFIIKWTVTLYKAANILLRMIYLYEPRTMRSPNLLMRLAGIEYERQPPGDPTATLWQRMTTMTPLATLMFGLRFVQWWQQQEESSHYSSSGLAPGDTQSIPPMPIPKAEAASRYKDCPGRCPVCQGRVREAVAIETGRVFCRECLRGEPLYRDQSKCPVTLRSVNKLHERSILVVAADE